jgi:hypothetical protein
MIRVGYASVIDATPDVERGAFISIVRNRKREALLVFIRILVEKIPETSGDLDGSSCDDGGCCGPTYESNPA